MLNHWGRRGVLLLASAAVIWFVAVFSVWLFVKHHRGLSDVGYTDLLLPGHWPRFRISEGNHYIARAEALVIRNETAAAVHWLRVGVSKSPANARGRLLLSRLYRAQHRPEYAREVLLGGLPQLSGDPVYLQATLSFLLELQEDALVSELANRLLASPAATPAPCRNLAASYAATAAYNCGNFDQAESLLHRHHLRDSVDGATLLARIEWERGYPELALLRLQGLIAQHPEQDSARALLAGYYRTLGRTGEWETALVQCLAGDPLAAAPRIEYLYFHHQRGDRPRLEQAVEAYLGQFRHDPAALLQLADFAANTGRPALARRVQQVSGAQGGNREALALLVAESHLAAGEYQAVLDQLKDCARQYPRWPGQFSGLSEGLQAAALCGLGRNDEARLYLAHLLTRKNLPADHLVALARRLSALGGRELSLPLLDRAVELEPFHQAALADLLLLEFDTGNLAAAPAQLDRLLHTRRPPRELLARAYAIFGSDRNLFVPRQQELLASLDAALAARRP